MIVRNFLDKDLDSLEKLYLECRLKTFHWVPKEAFKRSDFSHDTKGETIYVLEIESKVKGFISIWEQDNFLHHLYIDPDFQGKGLGQFLLKTSLERGILKCPVRLKCVVRNESACRFYEKLGWKVESTSNDETVGPYHIYLLDRWS